MAVAPTLREVIAESGGAEVVKRTGKARIQGVDYVRRPVAEWLTSGKPTRGTRKPTADELASRWAMAERQWSDSCEVAGWRRQAWRVADGRFSLRYQRALMAAIDYRTATGPPKRKPTPTPKPEVSDKPSAKSARVDAERDLIRLYKSELIALGTPAAQAEIERRKAKRAAKRAAREVVA